ncbi:MinD/ParA family ATP-binding protein [Actinophytocola sp.]|uniref:MinD/ParA family ATP-binding protein n=1 Tax=Actinophytocola sp. TaxID=1872138 RepID=UPI002D28F13F|nr:AAA family ATPase [Actinophytocola sp.]HYQ65685.1 AAA family ATPase [Actinophytocola sp.]
MSAHGEPEGGVPRVGVGQEPPTEDFGPRPLVSDLENEDRSESRPYQDPNPQYADPSAPQQQQSGAQPAVSGPYRVPYVDQTPSGSQAAMPSYVDQTPSGAQPAVSGPYRVPYVDQTPSGSQPAVSGPHQMQQGSGPHQVPQGSGPHQVQQGSGPHHVTQGSGPYQVPPQAYQQQVYQQQYPVQSQQAQQAQQAHGHSELSSQKLIKQQKRPPQSGWRKAVFVASGRLINVGESPNETHRRELITRVNQPLRGCYKIAMLSLKGGVGKTTTTTTLGSTFASLRGDRVIAVDANPDRGTLSQKIPLETTATVRHLLRDVDNIKRYSDIRAYTSQGPSRLEVLASEQDPAVSEAFSEDDYRRTVTLLEHFYNIVLTDCGTGLMHSAMKGVLDLADSLVVVSSGSVDGARSASATLDWLDAHGYRDLVARSVAVINSVRPQAGSVDLDKLAQHFGARCRAVCRIPFDPHLEEGAEIELDRLSAPTRLALLELAATVADGFPSEFYYMR